MNKRTCLLWTLAAFIFWSTGCQESNPTEPDNQPRASTISGKVVNNATNDSIPYAKIVDIGDLAQSDSSDLSGNYSLTFNLTSAYNTTLVTIRPGYFTDSTKVSLAAGENKTLNIRLRVNIQDSTVFTGISGPAASIVLKKQSAPTIALKGTGNNESCVLTFVVKDSLGNPVIGANRCLVKFAISGGPGGGEFLLPSSALTNINTGEVSTTVSSGILPGVLQVIASARGDTVKASPVFLATGGGLPDSAGVSIGATKLNIAGRKYANLQTTINMIVLDRFGSPVADGTVVSFVAPGARLSSNSATTAKGIAAIDLFSTANQPPGGTVTVNATTTGDKYYRPSDSTITRQMSILFSGSTITPIVDTARSLLNISDGGFGYIHFIVSDDLGNPLVSGSKITVTVKGPDTLINDLYLSNASIVLQDFNTPGPGRTQFTVGFTDKGIGKASGNITFGIEIVSENGNYKNESWLRGFIGQGSASFNIPASIDVADSSVRSLYLAETGLTNQISKTVTFIVKDALGNPVSGQTPISFSLNGFPTDVTLSRTLDTTTLAGRVSVKISSGNTRGSGTIDASTTTGQIIRGSSLPIEIARGLPVPSKVRVTLDRKNLFNTLGKVAGTVTLSLLDKDSYYPAPQSNITGSVSSGDIGIIPQTVNGQASFSLYGGPDRGAPAGFRTGFGVVRTFIPVSVANGSIYKDSVIFLFSYAPQITITSPSLDTLADGGSRDVTFDIKDLNNNPISSHNTLTVSLKGDVSSEIELSGDISKQSFDDDTSLASTHYKLSLMDKLTGGGRQGKFTVTILVSGESGTATKSFDVYLLPPVATEKISFASATNMTLGVLGSGSASIQTSQIIFRVTDKNGQKIDANNWVYVDFSLSSTAGGADINPKRVKTDADGEATTTFYAGNQYGTFQVTASFLPFNKTVPIVSTPVTFTIGGPSKANFSLSLSKRNIPGAGAPTTLQVGSITVLALDSLNVPVLDGTLVSFRSTGGTIERQVSMSSGAAIGKIFGGATPNTSALGGKGFGYVHASVAGNLGTTISDSLPFLLSGPPMYFQFTDAAGNPATPLSTPILDGGSATVYFKVRDANWRPVSNDYVITVAVEGDTNALQVKNISVIRDLQSMADTTQICKFDLQDLIKNGGPSGPIDVKITVAAPNLGSLITNIPGTLASAIGRVGTRVQTLQFVSSSTAPIYVRNTGLPEFTALTFALIDSNGQAVAMAKADTVEFSISSKNGIGSEQLSTAAMLSNVNSQVMTNFYAGTRSGTFTVTAKVRSLPTIQATKDITVIGGFPNQNKFTMQWETPDTLMNVPGFVVSGTLAKANILALDQYSNPAKPSVIQFDGTTGGSALAVTTDDFTGRATATLIGGNPMPAFTPGYGYLGYLKAYTYAGNQTYIRDSLKYLYTSSPRVNIVDTSMGMRIADGGFVNVSFSISDIYGQALAGGNTIAVTVEPAAFEPAVASSLTVQGDMPETTPNNQVVPTTYHLKVSDITPNGGIGGSYTIKIAVSGISGSVVKTIAGTLVAPPVPVITAPTQLVLSTVSSSIIAASGTGGLSTSDITFQALDAGGRAIGTAQSDTMFFTLSDTAGGAHLLPSWAMTDNLGKASTKLYAGVKYNALLVSATMNTGAATITATPVPVRISGPVLSNFTLSLSRKNLPGLSKLGTSVGDIRLQVGDTLGNPVLSNTLVSFSTNGGMVDPLALTGTDGSASVRLYGGACPTDATLGVGYGYITAKTKGNNGATLQQKIPFLFSGAPIVTVPAYPTGILPTINDGGFTEVSFTVADSNGNPLSSGNTIMVTAEGEGAIEMRLTDYTYTTVDTWDKVQGTNFKFKATDINPSGGSGGRLRFKITVSGDNLAGGAPVTKILESYLLAPGVVGGSNSGSAKSVTLVDALSKRSIYVRGSGGIGTGRTETATLVFEARDSLGRLIDSDHATLMRFAFVGDSLGAEITIRSAVTDPSGRVTTLVRAGTHSGVPIIRAYTVTYGDTVRSDLVAVLISTGFPDKRHFSLSSDQYNFPGLNFDGYTAAIRVQAGDDFGNPVPEGIPVWFSSMHGVVETRQAFTDAVGVTSQKLFSGSPRPQFADTLALMGEGSGWSYLKAWTRGEFGEVIQDSLHILWTGPPVDPIVWGVKRGANPVALYPDTFTVAHLGSAGPWSFKIKDRWGHPLSKGTTISITALAATIAGTTTATLPDVQVGGNGITDFTVALADAHGPTDTPGDVFSILVVTVVHPLYGKYEFHIAQGHVY